MYRLRNEGAKMTTYCYSTDKETFYGDFATPEDAAYEALDGNPDDESAWVGESVPVTAHEFVGPYRILDAIVDNAYEDHLASEGWLKELMRNEEKLAELKKLVGDWIQANEPPKFFSVKNVRVITREEVDL